MRAWSMALGVALLAACSGDGSADGEPTDDPTDDASPAGEETDTGAWDTATGDTAGPVGRDTDPDCVGILDAVPAAGTEDVYFRSTFYVEFADDEASTARFRLEETLSRKKVPTGPITWSDAGDIASFLPPEGLAPDTDHTWILRHSCGTDRISFHTTKTGRARVKPEDILGATYVLDLSTATFVQPAGVNALLQPYLGQVEYHLSLLPVAADADTLTLVTGAFDQWGWQDPCAPTTQLPDADFSGDPYFSLVVPDGLALPVGPSSVRLLELEMSGAFSPDGATLDGVRLDGTLDLRTVSEMFGVSSSLMCSLVAGISGVTCGPCPDGSGDGCVDAVVTGITGRQQPGFDLLEISEDDVADEPFCP